MNSAAFYNDSAADPPKSYDARSVDRYDMKESDNNDSAADSPKSYDARSVDRYDMKASDNSYSADIQVAA